MSCRLGLAKINRSSPAYAINENKIEQLAIEIQDLDEVSTSLRIKLQIQAKLS